jgi:hypothetical protein
VKGPIDQIFSCLPVAELWLCEGIIAEEVEGAWENGSGIVETLNSCSEGDRGSCFYGNFSELVFGEGGSLSFDEVVKLVIFVVN